MIVSFTKLEVSFELQLCYILGIWDGEYLQDDRAPLVSHQDGQSAVVVVTGRHCDLEHPKYRQIWTQKPPNMNTKTAWYEHKYRLIWTQIPPNMNTKTAWYEHKYRLIWTQIPPDMNTNTAKNEHKYRQIWTQIPPDMNPNTAWYEPKKNTNINMQQKYKLNCLGQIREANWLNEATRKSLQLYV